MRKSGSRRRSITCATHTFPGLARTTTTAPSTTASTVQSCSSNSTISQASSMRTTNPPAIISTRSCAPRTATTTARTCCASITRGTIIPTRGARTASAKSSVIRPAPVSLIGLLICNTFPPKLRPAIFRFNTKHAPRLSPSPIRLSASGGDRADRYPALPGCRRDCRSRTGADRQGVVPLRTAPPDILSSNTPALSSRMVNLIAELVRDWHRLDERIAAVSAEIELLAEVRLVPHGRAIHIGTFTLSGHLIAGSYLPKARAWPRAPCRNPPSLRISSAPLLDCSGRVPPAPDLPKGLRAAFPLWHSGPPTQC